jgi:hypothetical protein
MADYDERVIAQTRAWVNGEAKHNEVDDECCPDFSCCHPDLFTQDRAARLSRLNNLLAKHGLPLHYDA